ncbi:hypothetical protein ACH4S8_37200 [Streptomyces sp. NPDC021080]|uniref:hypothetical protein n=1 Tax=Streptomyces sp. NPDC021080 TaxID=3365110 RepID=UPI0037ABACF2
MDPVALEPLLYALRSADAETVTVPFASLTPGSVIAEGPWSRHLVTKRPMPVGGGRHTVTIRHLFGGHNITHGSRSEALVTVYAQTLDAGQISRVPVVPRCAVPEVPQAGDRVFQHFHEVDRLGEGRFFEYNGTQWQQVRDIADGRGKVSTVVQTWPSIRHLVANPVDPSPLFWCTYLPAGHRPFLYVDGRPMPARTVDELTVGDTILIPGGGRLRVTDVRRTRSAATLSLTLLRASAHTNAHFLWDRTEGAVIEHHDSGRTRSLYATEPRADELISAVDLQLGDTVITSYGLPYSAVAVIEQVCGQPFLQHMNVYSTATDGRPLRAVTGLASQYYLLHRRQPTASHARGGWDVRARAHA